ncbi:MAG: hypothetical protein PHY91_01285 [Tissierellia bacterium]|nr:hypothetical protein [Tissierellia bacterium]MDD4725962.1 hypothetical protein [Tissierellia bacterium]
MNDSIETIEKSIEKTIYLKAGVFVGDNIEGESNMIKMSITNDSIKIETYRIGYGERIDHLYLVK